jgi:Flp pilus assembly protein TadD
MLIDLFNNGRFAELERRARVFAQQFPKSEFIQKALGTALLRQGKNALAVVELQKSIELKSDDAEAHHNLANALKHLGRLDEAAASYRRALEINPVFYQAHYDLGVTLNELGRPEDAAASYRSALALRPDFADAHNNLGTVLRDLGQLDDSAASCRQALALNPNFVSAYGNLGNTLRDLGLLDDAEASYRRALELAPDLARARYNLSMLLLSQGRYAEGWQQYECRWQTGLLDAQPQFAVPLWLGEVALENKSILLHAEQGFGDTLQFMRYATLLAERGATVYLEVQRSLKSLAASGKGVAGVFGVGESLPPFDYHCPLMSLPLACKTELATIPAASPYLSANADKVAYWRGKLGQKAGLRVGLAWAGGTRKHLAWMDPVRVADRQRSIRFDRVAPLLELAGIEFFSLQLQDEAARLANAHPRLVDYTTELGNFDDTAALMENLDLVVCVDTSVAHLAGALGKPVWLLNRNNSCWRWLTARTDTPWYPSMRIFRQSTMGEWADVIDRVKRELALMV